MERYGRRNRRGRCPMMQPPPPARTSTTASTFVTCLQTIIVVGSLVALLYMMLDFHCKNCTSKCEIAKLSKHIDEIAANLSYMQGYYVELEKKVSKFSQDLPKMEGQIDVLEKLAQNLVLKKHEWNSNSRLTLPTSSVYLKPAAYSCNSMSQKNSTNMSLPCWKASQIQ